MSERTMQLQGDGLTLRPVDEGDLEALLGVYCQCEDFLALGPVPHASAEMVRADLALSRARGGVFCGVYLTGGERDEMLVGVVDFVPQGFEGQPDQAFLSLLMLSTPYRGRGLGRAVVQLVEEEIRRNPQVRVIEAGVQVNNPSALRFWQRNGYQVVGEPQHNPDGTVAFPLRKMLGPREG